MNLFAMTFLPKNTQIAMKETKEKGKFFCPACKKKYTPDHPTKEESPEGTSAREQHISGICSDKCWEDFLGPEPE